MLKKTNGGVHHSAVQGLRLLYLHSVACCAAAAAWMADGKGFKKKKKSGKTKATKRKADKAAVADGAARARNPKAFVFASKGKAKSQRARTAERDQKRMHGATASARYLSAAFVLLRLQFCIQCHLQSPLQADCNQLVRPAVKDAGGLDGDEPGVCAPSRAPGVCASSQAQPPSVVLTQAKPVLRCQALRPAEPAPLPSHRAPRLNGLSACPVARSPNGRARARGAAAVRRAGARPARRWQDDADQVPRQELYAAGHRGGPRSRDRRVGQEPAAHIRRVPPGERLHLRFEGPFLLRRQPLSGVRTGMHAGFVRGMPGGLRSRLRTRETCEVWRAPHAERASSHAKRCHTGWAANRKMRMSRMRHTRLPLLRLLRLAVLGSSDPKVAQAQSAI